MRTKSSKNVVLEKSLQSNYWRAADAEAVLSSWRESGLSLRAFAQRHGLSVSRLDRWKARLGVRGRLEFHRVQVVQAAPLPQVASGVDVVLRGGRRVRVRRGFDASLLEAVARAVESWPC